MPTQNIAKVVEVRLSDGRLTISHLGVVLAEHLILAPGETSILDEHYGGPRAKPRRAVRPRTPNEVACCALGPVAELFIKRAAPAGMTSFKGDLEILLGLERAHGSEALLRALTRAIEFRRLRAHDVELILLAGHGVARPTPVGETLITVLPVVAKRSLHDYRVEVNS